MPIGPDTDRQGAPRPERGPTPHTAGFDLNFEVIRDLFHGQREVISDVAQDEGISFDEAATFVPDAIAETEDAVIAEMEDDDIYTRADE